MDKTNSAFLEYARNILKANGYKKTDVREYLLELFSANNQTLSAYEIKKTSKERKLNVVTVYRTLKTFEDLGLIHYIASQNGYAKCLFANEKENTSSHHSFLVCIDCHEVTEYLDQANCSSHDHKPNSREKFHCLSHIRETLGHCHSCFSAK